MNVLALSLVFALVLVPVMGGRYASLKSVRFAMEWLVPIGFVTQLLLPLVLHGYWGANPRTAELAAWLTGSALLLGVCLANARRAGFLLAGLGLTLNGIVIASNGGMPISSCAMSELGVASRAEQTAVLTPLYHLQDSATVLAVLGDALPLPGPPLVRSIVSVGDMVLMVGIVVVILDGARALPACLRRRGRHREK